jgi:hypothetical protein
MSDRVWQIRVHLEDGEEVASVATPMTTDERTELESVLIELLKVAPNEGGYFKMDISDDGEFVVIPLRHIRYVEVHHRG